MKTRIIILASLTIASLVNCVPKQQIGENTMQVRSGHAEVNGTRLYYETAGEGPALVLIHGGLMDRRMWEEQFTLFAKDYQVIRYDIRGYEKSQKLDPNESFSHVEDLYGLLKHLLQNTYHHC